MENLVGQKFGRLTVVSFCEIRGHNYYWNCVCDCGNESRVQGGTLKRNGVVSCGCYHIEKTRKHGLDGNKLYHVLNSMKHRCHSEKSSAYARYGGRGISVCDEWKNDPISFVKWANENGYEEGLTIDRIDNDGNYCPENCRWVDRVAQSHNYSKNTWIEYKGETKTICDWADEYGITRPSLCYRIYTKKMTIEEALNIPPQNKNVETIPNGSTHPIDTVVEAEN